MRRVYRWERDPEGKDNRANFCDLVRELYQWRKDGRLVKAGYKSVVIDIVDNLYSMCLNHVCARKGIDYPPESDFGKTWKEIREEWETWLRRLMDVVNVTFITHCAKDKVEMTLPNGVTKEIERHVPTFKGNKAAQFLDGIINCMGFVHKNAKGEYVITFRGSPQLGTGDRTKVLEALGPMYLNWNDVAKAYDTKAKEMGFAIASKWS